MAFGRIEVLIVLLFDQVSELYAFVPRQFFAHVNIAVEYRIAQGLPRHDEQDPLVRRHRHVQHAQGLEYNVVRVREVDYVAQGCAVSGRSHSTARSVMTPYMSTLSTLSQS